MIEASVRESNDEVASSNTRTGESLTIRDKDGLEESQNLENCSGDRYSLLLPAGELESPLSNLLMFVRF